MFDVVVVEGGQSQYISGCSLKLVKGFEHTIRVRGGVRRMLHLLSCIRTPSLSN